MALQRRRGIKLGQGVVHLVLKRVVRSAMVQIVTDACYYQS